MNDKINAVMAANHPDDSSSQHFVRPVEKSRPGASQKRIIQFTGGTSSDHTREDISNFQRIEEKKLTTEGSIRGGDSPEVAMVNETGNSLLPHSPPESIIPQPQFVYIQPRHSVLVHPLSQLKNLSQAAQQLEIVSPQLPQVQPLIQHHFNNKSSKGSDNFYATQEKFPEPSDISAA